MDTLRIILVILGIILLVGIYLADRFKRRKKRHQTDWGEVPPEEDGDEPGLPGFTTADEQPSDEWVGKAVTLTAKRHEQLAEEQLQGLKGLGVKAGENVAETKAAETPSPVSRQEAEEVPHQPEEVIVLTVMAHEGSQFSGPLLLKVLQEVGLEHGDMGIFHFHVAARNIPLFSVANILEPGYFELSEIAALETPGLVLFLRLPTVVDGQQALEILLQKSQQMAAQLGGDLCDAQRRPLEETALAELQSKAKPYQALV